MGKGRAAGRVGSDFVGNRETGRVNVHRVRSGRVGSKKSDPWTTLIYPKQVTKHHELQGTKALLKIRISHSD